MHRASANLAYIKLTRIRPFSLARTPLPLAYRRFACLLLLWIAGSFSPLMAGTHNSSKGEIRPAVLYHNYCSVCHGDKGDGRSRAQNSLNPPPLDFTAPGASAVMTQQRMITSVTFGRPDTAMAGFKTQLSKEEISAVVDYIRAGFMASKEGISGISNARRQAAPDGPKAATTAMAASAPKPATGHIHKHVGTKMSAPMPSGLKGNVDKGGAFYKDNCATCHGKTGDGRGPRAYFINPKPRDFLHPASRQVLNRVELFEMISEGKPGTDMPAWNKVLSPQEIANVAEFVFQRFIQSGAGSAKSANAAKQ